MQHIGKSVSPEADDLNGRLAESKPISPSDLSWTLTAVKSSRTEQLEQLKPQSLNVEQDSAVSERTTQPQRKHPPKWLPVVLVIAAIAASGLGLRLVAVCLHL